MPLTLDEIIADGSQVGAFVARVRAAVESLPAPAPGEPVKVGPYASLIGGLLPDLGKLVDQIAEDVRD